MRSNDLNGCGKVERLGHGALIRDRRCPRRRHGSSKHFGKGIPHPLRLLDVLMRFGAQAGRLDQKVVESHAKRPASRVPTPRDIGEAADTVAWRNLSVSAT